MKKALEEAHRAYDAGEVPVGAVIVRNSDGMIISSGINSRERDKNALAHAEINAVSKACETIGGYRLGGFTVYVTLEPCPMCAGACVMSGISRVVFGAADSKNGAVSSNAKLFDGQFTFSPEFEGGVLQEECAGILKKFFSEKRKSKKSVAFSFPENEYQLQRFYYLSGKNSAENPVFIRKNGKIAGTAELSDNKLADINILKEYGFCLNTEDVTNAFGKGE